MNDATPTLTPTHTQPKPIDAQGKRRKKRRQLVKMTPWKDVYEWQLVGHKLRGALELIRDGRIVTSVDSLDTHDLEEALRTCQVWKVRCANTLPHAIESSYSLAQLLFKDAATTTAAATSTTTTYGNASSDSIILQLSYSTAIIRSVNGLADSIQQRRRSAAPVSHLCATLGLPGWIVDIRHEATHNALPSLPQLRLAAHTMLGFFLEKYWHVVTGSRQHLMEGATQLLHQYMTTRRTECVGGLKHTIKTRLDSTVLSLRSTPTSVNDANPDDNDDDDDDNDDNDDDEDIGESDQMDDEEDWLANNYFAALVRDTRTTRQSSTKKPSEPNVGPPKKKIKTFEKPPINAPKMPMEARDHVSSSLALQFVKTVPQDVAYHAALSFFIWGEEGSVGVLLSGESDYIFQPLLERLCQTWPGFLVAVVTHAVEYRSVHEYHPTGDCPLAQWMRRNRDFLRSHESKIPVRHLAGRLANDCQLRQAIQDIYQEGRIEKSVQLGNSHDTWTLAEHWEECTIGILPGHIV